MSYLSDICQQPTVLRSLLSTYQSAQVWQLLHQTWQQGDYQSLVLTGMGASYNALVPTWLYLNQQGTAALHIETSELIYYLSSLLQRSCLFVVVSQSGESIEIRRLLEKLKAQSSKDSFIVSVTNEPGNSLSNQSDLSLHTQAGAEVGVATKTYTSTLALLHWLGRALMDHLQPQDYQVWDGIAAAIETRLRDWQIWLKPAVEHLRPATHYALIARGPSLASAINGGLILKEAVRLPAEGFSGGQFRHGPLEMLTPNLGILMFTTPGQTVALQHRLAQDIVGCGSAPVCIGEAVNVPGVINLTLPAFNEECDPGLNILAVQLLAAQLAEQAGIIPGKFRWGGKVVQTE